MSVEDCVFTWLAPQTATQAGSLQGLRLGVKDLFHIEGAPTAAGNPDWLNSHQTPSTTAEVVQQLLDEGCQLVGKTLTDELAYSLNGVNFHYGTPTNPTAPERLPGGSSSGSAVATADERVDIGLGTDTGGSIRVPSSYCGIYGLRPSHGRISTEGLLDLAPAFDTVGWMCRDFDTLDRVSTALGLASSSPGTLKALTGSRVIAVQLIDDLGGPSNSLPARWASALQSLRGNLDAALCKESIEIGLSQLQRMGEVFRILQGRQIWAIHGAWLQSHQPRLASDIEQRLQWCSNLSQADEDQALVQRQIFVEEIKTQWLDDGRQQLLLPTTPGAAPLLTTPAADLAEYRNTLLGMTAPAGLAGLPQISLPWLKDDAAPWGVSLLGTAGGDEELLARARSLDELMTRKEGAHG